MLTLSNVKTTLNIQGKDEQITSLIPLVEDYIRNYCNDSFTDGLPPGYELIAIRMIEYNLLTKAGVASESLSRHSLSFNTEFPSDITKGLKRKLRW